MSMSLEEALGAVDLEVGKTYVCRLNGKEVVVRVRALDLTLSARGISEGDIMLDPWTELPMPKPMGRVLAKPGKSLRLDVPDIPQEEESL